MLTLQIDDLRELRSEKQNQQLIETMKDLLSQSRRTPNQRSPVTPKSLRTPPHKSPLVVNINESPLGTPPFVGDTESLRKVESQSEEKLIPIDEANINDVKFLQGELHRRTAELTSAYDQLNNIGTHVKETVTRFQGVR